MRHPLSGADPATLIRLVRHNGWPSRRSKFAGIVAATVARLPWSALEYGLTAGAARRAARTMPPPVFILGHWRSGTTHLYDLMAGGGFGYVPPVPVGLPWDMQGLGRLLSPVLERALPEDRAIDQMEVTPTSPQEDEIALGSMCDLAFCHALYFPLSFDRLIDRGVFLDGASPAEIARWEDRVRLFYGKLYRQTGARLLIKNPVYTARIAHLRQLFPEARFVFLHRAPIDIVRSMRNFYRKLLALLALQDVPPDIDLEATIVRVFDRMMRAYAADADDLPPDRLVEVGYGDLVGDPLAALRTIWERLDLTGFETALPGFKAHLESVRDYRTNRFEPDDADERAAEALRPWAERWGYQAIARPATSTRQP